MLTAFKRTGLRLSSYVWCAMLLVGCASDGHKHDPFEGFNRPLFKVHQVVDRAVFKPVAEGYADYMPTPIQTATANFFSHWGNTMPTMVNHFLQGDAVAGATSFGRFLINAFLGLGGLIDVASSAGVQKTSEDFGQTLAVWGVPAGPYWFFPLLGPRTTRGLVGPQLIDRPFDAFNAIEHAETYWQVALLRGINARVQLLPADKLIREAALDEYGYIRDAYLALRKNAIGIDQAGTNDSELLDDDALFEDFEDDDEIPE